MKRTLFLAAFSAAFISMLPYAAQADTAYHYVQGIEFGTAGDWSTATGWFDANKDWTGDGLMCWAAASSNLVAWWQTQNGFENVELSAIWDDFRRTFKNGDGIIKAGVVWWLDGSGVGNEAYELHLREGVTEAGGGYYKANLTGGRVLTAGADVCVLSTNKVTNAAAFSSSLVNYIDSGYGVGANFVNGNQGHAETIWGVATDESGMITMLYLSDSDDRSKGSADIPAIRQEPVFVKTVGNTQMLALTYSPNWSLESVELINSKLSNDIKNLNYIDENNNVILKQKTGNGFTLSGGLNSVNNIVYDGSMGNQLRQINVDGQDAAFQAAAIQLNAAAGSNVLNITAGSTLSVQAVNGSGKLTKTGAGTLEIADGTTAFNLEVNGGEVTTRGLLGEVTLNGGSLQSGGTAGKLIVNSGSTAEILRTETNKNQKVFTETIVNDGGTLKGSGTFGKVTVNEGGTLVVGNSPGLQTYDDELIVLGGKLVFSIDDALNSYNGAANANQAGWGSGRYSAISMKNNSLTLKPDVIEISLGETILKRSAGVSDLKDALGKTFTVNLSDVDLLMDQNTMSNPLFDYYTGAAALQGLADVTTFSLSNEAGAFSVQGLQATITPESVAYVTRYGTDVAMNAKLNVTLSLVPEPAAATLFLPALAGLCARRRRRH